MKPLILPKAFYLSEDVVHLSKALLGKYLVTKLNGVKTAGMIIETEAYQGITDKASHAYSDRRTSRTETMYSEGGVAYIYLCYGIHHLFNVVTGPKECPHAVLIRAIEPTEGIPQMLLRRKLQKPIPRMTSGPGTLTQALGITTAFDGFRLNKEPIWLEDRGVVVLEKEILASSRVGIDYAEEHRDLPWRFQLRNKPQIL